MKSLLFYLLSTVLVSGEEARFYAVYKQGYDTSCGIAVTAALLNNYWNIPAAEADLYQDMILSRLTNNGEDVYTISFLDIMRHLQEKGIAARAYKMDWDELADTLAKGYAPVVINYDKPRPHFALLMHIEKDYAFMADPSRGSGLVYRTDFERDYSGNALLTAGRTALKDEGRIQQIVQDEGNRLSRLEDLARKRRRR